MSKKYIIVSMDDERSKKISEVLGNKTCKKIIEILSEKEASEKDLADFLEIPINTVEYNLNKLVASGLVEKTKNFFWSKKGRKIDMYLLSNKSILISPKAQISSKIKAVAPVAIITILASLIIWIFQTGQSSKIEFAGQSGEIMSSGNSSLSYFPAEIWFLIGGLFALFVFVIYRWKKI